MYKLTVHRVVKRTMNASYSIILFFVTDLYWSVCS